MSSPLCHAFRTLSPGFGNERQDMTGWLGSDSQKEHGQHHKSMSVVEQQTSLQPAKDISKCQRCGVDPEMFKHELHPYDVHYRCLFCESCVWKLIVDIKGAIRAHDFECPCCGALVRRVYDLRAPEKPFWFSLENGPFWSSPPAANVAPFRAGAAVYRV